MLVWEKARDQFNTIGLDTNLWDKETIAVHSYPTFLKDIEKAARYILGGGPLRRGDHDALARAPAAPRSWLVMFCHLAPQWLRPDSLMKE